MSTALLGRTNYEGSHGYWPAVAKDPAANERDRDFAMWLDAVMQLDLLDELHIAVLPSVLGRGSRLFPEAMSPSTWQLAGTTTFPTGAIGLHYRRP